MNSLQPYQERVIEEQRELIGKLNKIMTFRTTEQFTILPKDEQDRLIKQSGIMAQYSDILLERIKSFIQ